MSFSFDDSKLKEFQRRLEAMKGEHGVPLAALLTDDFICQHSDFHSLAELLDASSIVDAEEIGNEKFSQFITDHTRFADWEEMRKEAAAEYYKRKLGL